MLDQCFCRVKCVGRDHATSASCCMICSLSRDNIYLQFYKPYQEMCCCCNCVTVTIISEMFWNLDAMYIDMINNYHP